MFELELPMDDGGISYINSKAQKIKTDIIICAKPNQTRYTKFPFKCYYIHFFITDGYLLDEMSSVADFSVIKNREKYEKIFAEICKCYNTFAKIDEIMLQSLLLKLIYLLIKQTSVGNKLKGITGNNHYISKALNFINENLDSELDLKTVADYVSLSPIHFHNCFKYALGKTLHSYIEEERIKRSVDLMLTTDMTLTEIAYNCGFSSQSYFSFVFKRKMGKTPREYIKDINNNYEM